MTGGALRPCSVCLAELEGFFQQQEQAADLGALQGEAGVELGLNEAVVQSEALPSASLSGKILGIYTLSEAAGRHAQALLHHGADGGGKSGSAVRWTITSPAATTATLPNSLGIANGTVLRDRLGGPSVTVQNGRITLTIPAQGAAILAP